ncbi:hypothetical protein B6U84_00050 [Candidatus Bathyarchaeota archaeon ex4484_40]|nr:MAG: hypothetical protein B6U84_00050 [Candidatus Bathyarchaeota archaeon ex4484_40]
MGLDNIPKPPPCLVLEKAGKLKVERAADGKIDCGKTACPFKHVPHIIGILGTYCWLRGGAYEDLVEELTEFDLYTDLNREQLEEMLKQLREPECEVKVEIAALLDGEKERLRVELIRYLETLLSTGWNGKLIAWY